MSPPVRPVPFWNPSGIDGRAISESPWELLLNIFPMPDGWRSFGGWRRCSTGSPAVQKFMGAGAFYDGHGEGLLRFGLDETNRLFYLETCNGRGNVKMHGYVAPGVEPVEHIDKYAMAALNGRVFFTADGRTLYVTAIQGVDNDDIIPMTPEGGDEYGGLSFALTDFVDGVNAVNWGYINDDFGAPVLESHGQRLFFGGFTSRIVSFSQELTDDQRFLLKDLVVTSTSVRLNAQCIVFTDADNPFAIGLANFIQIGTKYPIKAMVSWKETLVIFTEGDVWTLTGTDNATFDLNRISEGVGCQDAYSACATPYGVVFGDRNGIHLCDGQSVKSLSSTIEHLFSEQTPIADSFSGAGLIPTHLAKDWGGFGYVASREEVWIPVSSSGALDSNQYLLVFSFRTGTWTMLTSPGTEYIEAVVPLGSRVFAVSGKNIYEAMISKGTATSVNCYMVTKPLLISEQSEQMVVGTNWLFRKTPVDGKLHMWGAESWADSDEQYGEYDIPTAPEWADADTRLWGTMHWGASRGGTWTADRSRTVRMDFLGRSGYWRIGLSCTSKSQTWLRGMEFLTRPDVRPKE